MENKVKVAIIKCPGKVTTLATRPSTDWWTHWPSAKEKNIRLPYAGASEANLYRVQVEPTWAAVVNDRCRPVDDGAVNKATQTRT